MLVIDRWISEVDFIFAVLVCACLKLELYSKVLLKNKLLFGFAFGSVEKFVDMFGFCKLGWRALVWVWKSILFIESFFGNGLTGFLWWKKK